jgi:hypothetical protein
MGILSGVVLDHLLRTLVRPDLTIRQIFAAVTQILAIPIFWFGGGGASWLASAMLAGVGWEKAIGPYVSSLAITFLAVVAYPLIRYIIRIGRDI